MAFKSDRWSRRLFLRSAAVAFAYGVAPRIVARNDAAGRIIDTLVYVGHWPLSNLERSDPKSLMVELRHHGVSRAWAGSFEGLFHKDVHGTNQRLAEICQQYCDDLLIPFGTVNPLLPDWEEDLRRCDEVFKMPGIRLHPTYHDYRLDDARVSRLLELAHERGLIVQLVANIGQRATRWLSPARPLIEIAALQELARRHSQVRLMVSGALRSRADGEAGEFSPHTRFDVSQVVSSAALREWVVEHLASGLAFASGAPLQPVSRNLEKLSELTKAQRETICAAPWPRERILAQ